MEEQELIERSETKRQVCLAASRDYFAKRLTENKLADVLIECLCAEEPIVQYDTKDGRFVICDDAVKVPWGPRMKAVELAAKLAGYLVERSEAKVTGTIDPGAELMDQISHILEASKIGGRPRSKS